MSAGLLLKVVEVAGTVLGTLAFALVTYWKMRERKLIKEKGLADNPERCGQHEARLNALEERIGREMDLNHEAHEKIFEELKALSVDIARLSRNGNGGGAK